MKCPHCLLEINETFEDVELGDDSEGRWFANLMRCPNEKCNKIIVRLECIERNNRPKALYFVRPISSTRPPAPIEVDDHIAQDYNEACAVISLSPKASAALSRRCLQNILREKASVKHGNLVNEIQEAIDKGIPSHIAESIDAIRNIGNFAAHPSKDKITGEIVDVEPEEAGWNLDVLELLFDFYYVQPELAKKKKAALDAKLASIGKPPMK